MATRTEPRLSAWRLLATGFGELVRPPFLQLLVLNLLLTAVTDSLPLDDSGILGLIVLLIVSAYLQIAVTIAAAEPDPGRSADPWVRAAFTRRVFWRFAGASVAAYICVGLGLLVLVIGAFVVGAALSVAQQAAVLERRLPGQALARSIQMTRPVLVTLGIVYGVLFIIPALAMQAAYITEFDLKLGDWWLAVSLATVPLGQAAQIALTRAFMALGGQVVPAPARPARPGA